MLYFIDSFHIMDQRKEVKLKMGRVYPLFETKYEEKLP